MILGVWWGARAIAGHSSPSLEISFYTCAKTCVPKATIMWGTVPKTQSETERIFVILGHLLPFFSTNNTENQNLKKKNKKNIWRCHHFTLVYQKSQYDLQFLIYRVWQTEIGNNVSFFALLPPIKKQKNQAFENMKKNLLELS